jgi:hypothetical protein
MEQHGQQQGISENAQITLTICKAKGRGWLMWDAGDSGQVSAACTTLAEVNDEVQALLLRLGRDNGNELPFRPQQQQLAYQPERSVQPQSYQMPQGHPAEPFPSVVERERTNGLAEQIAKVRAGNARVATVQVAYICMAAAALWQIWPFGA